MAGKRRLKPYWLALGGAVAAHALVLSLPWPGKPDRPSEGSTLAVQLPRPAPATAPTEPEPRAKPAPGHQPPAHRRQVVTTALARPATPAKHTGPVKTRPVRKVTPRHPALSQKPAPPAAQISSSGPAPVPKAKSPSPVVPSPARVPPVAHAGPAPVVSKASPPSQPPEEPGKRRERFQARLMAHLAHFRHYPLLAQRERQQGVVEVRFVMDRAGHILSDHLVRRSPYPLLNHEALALLDRAQPLPRPPASLAGQTLAWTLPVRFRLP